MPPIRTPSKTSKQIFAGKTISFAGDFTEARATWRPDDMMRWVKNHGATYVRDVNEETTHLICTIKEYQARTKQVRKAWELGRRCYIVVADWLEACLAGRKGSVRFRSEKPYALNLVLARTQKGKLEQVRFQQRFMDGVKQSEELVDNRLHHIYYDDCNFEYKIVLTRVNLGGRNMIEKYIIFLFRSIAKPHTYMCGAKFSRSHRKTTYYREECHPKLFHEAFADFKRFFESKTQVHWDLRLEGIRKGEEAFVYTPPRLGMPVGNLPPGYVRPELREVEASSSTKSGEGGEDGSGDSSMSEGDDVEGLVYGTDAEAGDSRCSGTTRSRSSSRGQDGSRAGSSMQPIVLSDGK